jgi:hypothetical protein
VIPAATAPTYKAGQALQYIVNAKQLMLLKPEIIAISGFIFFMPLISLL